jgi:NADH-quinone oxidoreductase subunit E
MSTNTLKIISPDLLSPTVRQEIDKWLLKFPDNEKQSAVIAALTLVQEENQGYLTTDLMKAVAAYLKMPAIAVFEVATFYSLFELNPVGKYKICVCTNISCMLSDSDKIVTHLKNKLGIGFGETTPDNRFTLKEVECLAACGGAPAMQIGPHYYENLTPEKIDQILENLT